MMYDPRSFFKLSASFEFEIKTRMHLESIKFYELSKVIRNMMTAGNCTNSHLGGRVL